MRVEAVRCTGGGKGGAVGADVEAGRGSIDFEQVGFLKYRCRVERCLAFRDECVHFGFEAREHFIIIIVVVVVVLVLVVVNISLILFRWSGEAARTGQCRIGRRKDLT